MEDDAASAQERRRVCAVRSSHLVVVRDHVGVVLVPDLDPELVHAAGAGDVAVPAGRRGNQGNRGHTVPRRLPGYRAAVWFNTRYSSLTLDAPDCSEPATVPALPSLHELVLLVWIGNEGSTV